MAFVRKVNLGHLGSMGAAMALLAVPLYQPLGLEIAGIQSLVTINGDRTIHVADPGPPSPGLRPLNWVNLGLEPRVWSNPAPN